MPGGQAVTRWTEDVIWKRWAVEDTVPSVLILPLPGDNCETTFPEHHFRELFRWLGSTRSLIVVSQLEHVLPPREAASRFSRGTRFFQSKSRHSTSLPRSCSTACRPGGLRPPPRRCSEGANGGTAELVQQTNTRESKPNGSEGNTSVRNGCVCRTPTAHLNVRAPSLR